MTMLTREEIQRGLVENRQAPNGAARNAHAEALAGAAEVSGDKALFRETLDNLINSYLYSAESSKMLVPFARLLQEYDKDPGAFSSWDTHSLFWQFKWVATAISDSPEVPVESATGWLEEMERRYRIAGYSERPVRESELWLADAIGQDERAERAFTRWLAADRDDMSDCVACELNGQGQYAVLRGDDAQALDIWKPVLTGERTCAEEPHRVLSTSLLPLLRLGRTDEARSNHLRGYRLVRGNESLLPSVGKHIEFCALTGNESRGLEILAEHAAHVGPLANVDDQLAFHGGILVLLRRLQELGHGHSPAVPYEGTPRTVAELHELLYEGALAIARRFDARNGTTRTSERFLARVGRAPLAGVLPLGVRSAALPHTAQAPAPSPVQVRIATAVPSAELAGLVEQARQARDTGRPAADTLWTEVAVLASGRPESEVHPILAADIADHQALTAARAGAQDAAELLTAVRDRYRALGQAERAALAQLRLATVAAQAGAEPGEVRELLAAGLRAAEALDPAEPFRGRRIAVAELSAIRLEPYLRSVEAAREHDQEHGHDHGHDAAHGHGGHGHGGGDDPHSHLWLEGELTAFVAAYAPTLADVTADAEEMLGRVALSQGDPERALPLLAASAARSIEAGRPWHAVDPLVLRAGVLMSLGRPEEAEEAARAGLDHSAEITDPEEQGVVRLTLADILLRRGQATAEAAEHALTATHWFDQAGLGADGGAQARLMLARAYARDGRTAEAVEVLQSALPDLLEHGEGQAVAAREFLGDLLRELRETRAAAEQYLQAAELAKDWEDRRPQASLAQSAADCLSDAGLVEEAVAAYERALELHRETGEAVIAEVRILRSLAWLGLRQGVTEPAAAAARARMDDAAGVLEAALEADPEAAGTPGLRSELAQTWHQLAQVLDRLVTAQESDDEDDDEDDEDENEGHDEGADRSAGSLSEAEIEALRLEEILLWERAAALYADLGPEHLESRFQCLNNAAWTDQELGHPETGAARISALIEELKALPEGTAPEWMLPEAERVVAGLTA
ncbi:tetratricopeptide repeat protein [Streptomyces sp. NBC_00249]|uniref:tetratricopeptide repeat protein n=1 Tax=Streptomyces sp. NBC_00249 TaxID=2975690 RepID=UPI0022575796|nr:tetratricopeptide repeat protein [Streptomyces sp. NBC_00249]MCX5196315.1 tetratricopeptide repeat protein [Streptomyces sp. NBC_00249]